MTVPKVQDIAHYLDHTPHDAWAAQRYAAVLQAVVVKCEAVRAESPAIGWVFADEFERVILDALQHDEEEG